MSSKVVFKIFLSILLCFVICVNVFSDDGVIVGLINLSDHHLSHEIEIELFEKFKNSESLVLSPILAKTSRFRSYVANVDNSGGLSGIIILEETNVFLFSENLYLTNIYFSTNTIGLSQYIFEMFHEKIIKKSEVGVMKNIAFIETGFSMYSLLLDFSGEDYGLSTSAVGVGTSLNINRFLGKFRFFFPIVGDKVFKLNTKPEFILVEDKFVLGLDLTFSLFLLPEEFYHGTTIAIWALSFYPTLTLGSEKGVYLSLGFMPYFSSVWGIISHDVVEGSEEQRLINIYLSMGMRVFEQLGLDFTLSFGDMNSIYGMRSKIVTSRGEFSPSLQVFLNFSLRHYL